MGRAQQTALHSYSGSILKAVPSLCDNMDRQAFVQVNLVSDFGVLQLSELEAFQRCAATEKENVSKLSLCTAFFLILLPGPTAL